MKYEKILLSAGAVVYGLSYYELLTKDPRIFVEDLLMGLELIGLLYCAYFSADSFVGSFREWRDGRKDVVNK